MTNRLLDKLTFWKIWGTRPLGLGHTRFLLILIFAIAYRSDLFSRLSVAEYKGEIEMRTKYYSEETTTLQKSKNIESKELLCKVFDTNVSVFN